MSDTREDKAAKAYQGGATLRELAIQNEVAPETIRKWVESKGVKMRRPGQPKKSDALPNAYTASDVAVALRKGVTVAQIARHLKVKPGVIYRIARDNGISGGMRG